VLKPTERRLLRRINGWSKHLLQVDVGKGDRKATQGAHRGPPEGVGLCSLDEMLNIIPQNMGTKGGKRALATRVFKVRGVLGFRRICGRLGRKQGNEESRQGAKYMSSRTKKVLKTNLSKEEPYSSSSQTD
jgi:hypothetical protein